MFDNLLLGLNFLINPVNFLLVILGVVLGIIVGILPGLGSTATLAILIPVSMWMTPTQAIAMMGALYASSTTGGSITSILFRIPGESSSAVTIFDGFPMAKKGNVNRALGLAMMASAIGGIFSAIILMTLSPWIAKVSLRFGQAEYFALCIFGMSAVASLGSKSQLKALISLCIGLFVVIIGMSEITGVDRFTFGSLHLRYGVSMVAVVVGLFGFAEFLRNTATIVFKKPERLVKPDSIKILHMINTIKSIFHMKTTMLRANLIGLFTGILPGTGSTIASLLAYNEEIRWSKHPEKFGTGVDEGIVAPEYANNAATGGALIPALTLGIPGSSTSAMILAALMSHGVTPGPRLFIEKSELIWGLFVSYFFANITMILFAFIGIWAITKVLNIPRPILNGIIFLLCVIGAYGINNNMIDVWIMFIFGFLGFFMEKHGFPLMPLVLGIILGPLAETALETGMVIYGSFWPFITRPLAATFLILSLLSALFPLIRNTIAHRKAKTSVT